MGSLSEKYHGFAVDLYGYGKSPDWPGGKDVGLGDEITLIAPILSKAGRFHLVGHSYGAHISIKIAIDNPDRVASLTLYEPTAFHLLEPGTAGRLEIEAVRDETKRFLHREEDEKAAERFVEYWVGPGAWRATPEQVRPGIIKGMRKVRFEWNRSFEPDYSREQIADLSMPILLLTGTRTTSAARGVVAALRKILPAADFAELPELGHMGPITHPEVVNDAILAFIDRHVAQRTEAG